MKIKPRIFLSTPADDTLETNEAEIKKEVIRMIEDVGFEVQYFHEMGLPASMAWNFESARQIMSSCRGAVVLSLARWKLKDESGNNIFLHSEYNHFEGALAVAMKLPLFIISEKRIAERGITYTGGGERINFLPRDASASYVKDDDSNLKKNFTAWADAIKAKPDVFLGYCSNAQATANAVITFLMALKISVRNYAMDFQTGSTILEEIQSAAADCACGIFLFTKDDTLLSNDNNIAAPRDNVIFEAGYFIRSKGKERVLIIKEEGAKMPADLGGSIYISLASKNDISPVQWKIQKFLEEKL